MLRKLKRRLKNVMDPADKIRIQGFAKSPHNTYVPADSPLSSGPLNSEIARYGRLHSDSFGAVLSALALTRTPHRKHWELAYVTNALADRGMLAAGRRGLAFAVGRERLPALFASKGCEIVATDLGGDDARSQVWNETDQWSDSVDNLCFPEIFDADKTRAQVSFRPVDMNHIPDDLTEFDFTWSTCSFEHCGSIDLGLRFVREQMKCLRPGGVAVHTTEFNLASQQRTIETGGTVVFRLSDIEALVRDLEADGHHVTPLDIRVGDHPLDQHIDTVNPATGAFSVDKHMRLLVGGFVSTSIGLIITKGGADAAPAGS